jgi:hypothetical protein
MGWSLHEEDGTTTAFRPTPRILMLQTCATVTAHMIHIGDLGSNSTRWFPEMVLRKTTRAAGSG